MFLTSVNIELLCISDLYPVPFLIWTLLSKGIFKIPGEAHGWEPHVRRGSSDSILREDYPPTSSNCSISSKRKKKKSAGPQCHLSICFATYPCQLTHGKEKGEKRGKKTFLSYLKVILNEEPWKTLSILCKRWVWVTRDTLRGSLITRKVISQEEIQWAVWSLGQPQSTHKGETGIRAVLDELMPVLLALSIPPTWKL